MIKLSLVNRPAQRCLVSKKHFLRKLFISASKQDLIELKRCIRFEKNNNKPSWLPCSNHLLVDYIKKKKDLQCDSLYVKVPRYHPSLKYIPTCLTQKHLAQPMVLIWGGAFCSLTNGNQEMISLLQAQKCPSFKPLQNLSLQSKPPIQI